MIFIKTSLNNLRGFSQSLLLCLYSSFFKCGISTFSRTFTHVLDSVFSTQHQILYQLFLLGRQISFLLAGRLVHGRCCWPVLIRWWFVWSMKLHVEVQYLITDIECFHRKECFLREKKYAIIEKKPMLLFKQVVNRQYMISKNVMKNAM